MSDIPSEEDFKRAAEYMRQRMLHLDDVCENIKRKYCKIIPLHDIFIDNDYKADFRVYLFFKANKDIAVCEKNGMIDELKKQVTEELVSYGRANWESTTFIYELDSHENVKKKFNGNYYRYFR